MSDLLGKSPQLTEFRETEEGMLNDPEAMKLMEEHDLAEREARRASYRGPDSARDAMENLNVARDRLMAHPAVKDHYEARGKLDDLIRSLNAVITFPITGTMVSREKECGGCTMAGAVCSGCPH